MSSLSMFVLIIIDIFIYYIILSFRTIRQHIVNNNYYSKSTYMNFYFKILNILDFDLFDFDHLTEICNWIALDKINRHFKKFIKTLTS